ncbi:MAG TPA: M15 family metallopeptidase [Nocardioides sp.]|nr:M15 family metallopeptidase [Nocardioides sp.]
MRTRLRSLAAAGTCALLAGCGVPGDHPAAPLPEPARVDGAARAGTQALAVPAPTPFRGRTASPDLLVYSAGTLPGRLRARLADVPGVGATTSLSVGQLALGGRTVHVAAADPADLRRFTARPVARADDVWARVAGGEVAVDPTLRTVVESGDGYLPLGQQPTAPRAYVGAFASLPPLLDVAVNSRWGRALGMPAGNAVLLAAAPDADPATVLASVERVVGKRAAVRRLGSVAQPPTGPQTGYLTGGAVASAVGSFTYVPRPDGTVAVDPGWVAAHIRTEEVPVLGRVTCHRVMLPQLRGALQEVVDRGLAASVRPGEYGGCFHPRYIGHDPAKGLSLHSWGIAVDLNVPGNQRGTAGEIDREVVAIFKRWGFAWGGDWAWTDPMHFELAALVRPG